MMDTGSASAGMIVAGVDHGWPATLFFGVGIFVSINQLWPDLLYRRLCSSIDIWIEPTDVVVLFHRRTRPFVTQTEIESYPGRHTPIILNIWPEQLPATPGCRASESLIVDPQADLAQEEIGRCIASNSEGN